MLGSGPPEFTFRVCCWPASPVIGWDLELVYQLAGPKGDFNGDLESRAYPQNGGLGFS